MASQLRKVTGNKRLVADPMARLNAKIAMLPRVLANRRQSEVIARDTAFQQKQIQLAKDAAKQRKREEEAAMGLEAGKLGLNISMSDMAKTSVGDLVSGTKEMFSPSGVPQATPTGGLYDIKPGTAIASGLTGYGIGKLLGGKSKAKKAGFGALSGGLMGLLSGGGNPWANALSSGLAGGLGGLIS